MHLYSIVSCNYIIEAYDALPLPRQVTVKTAFAYRITYMATTAAVYSGVKHAPLTCPPLLHPSMVIWTLRHFFVDFDEFRGKQYFLDGCGIACEHIHLHLSPSSARLPDCTSVISVHINLAYPPSQLGYSHHFPLTSFSIYVLFYLLQTRYLHIHTTNHHV
jgi:hypothetical protein